MARRSDRDANRDLWGRLHEAQSKYQQLRSGMDQLRDELSRLRVTVRTKRGTIAATVGPRGELIRLELSDRIYDNADAEALAAKITEVVQEAAAEAARRVQELTSQYLPSDLNVGEAVRTNDFGALLRRHDAVMSEDAERGGA